MHKRHGTRRWILGSLVVLAVAVAALGSGPGASAEIKTTKPRPGYASRAEFMAECAAFGGMFIDNGTTIRCEHQDGTVIECDLNGTQCTVTNISQQPGGGANLPGGTGEQNESDGGGTGFPSRPQERLPDTLPNLPGAND